MQSIYNYTDNFHWREVHSNKILFLLSGKENTISPIIPLAIPSKNCSDISVGIFYGGGHMTPEKIGKMMAHEIGYILNLKHDHTCESCIMNPRSEEYDHPWSQQMKEDLRNYLEEDFRCLKNIPRGF